MQTLIAAQVLPGEAPAAYAQADSPTNLHYHINYQAVDVNTLSDSEQAALVGALTQWPGAIPSDSTFFLEALRQEKGWAIATLSSGNLSSSNQTTDEDQSSLANHSLFNVVLAKSTGSRWLGALDTSSTPTLNNILQLIPLSELSAEARQNLFPSAQKDRFQLLQQTLASNSQAYHNYKLPWRANQAWRLTQGWHSTEDSHFPQNTSLDIAPVGLSNADVLAAAGGTVTGVCGTKGKYIRILTSGTNEYFGYLHLDPNSVVAANIKVGTVVTQGQKLGTLTQGGYSDQCGTSGGTHLHVAFPVKPFTIDGVTFTDTNVHWGENLYSTQGTNGGNNSLHFELYNRVKVNVAANDPDHGVYVWSKVCGGTSYGIEPNGTEGRVVTASNQVQSCFGSTFTWNEISWADGRQGWVASEFLTKPGNFSNNDPVTVVVANNDSDHGVYIWQNICGGKSFGIEPRKANGTVINAVNHVQSCFGSTYSWNQIRFADGRTGWVASEFLVKRN